MRPLPWPLLASVFFLFLNKANAQVRDLSFYPPQFFVGDVVELRIDIELENPMNVEFSPVLPGSDWLEIRDVSIETVEDRVSILIVFSSYAPGTQILPPINLGPLILDDVEIPTSSTLSKAHGGIRLLRGQKVMPGTRLELASVLALLTITPFLAYGLFRILRLLWGKCRDLFQNQRPLRRVQKLSKKLRANISSMRAPQWYHELSNGLRDYLSSRLGQDCTSATTAEIALMKVVRGGPRKKFLEVLKEGDLVKFAGRQTNAESLGRSLDMLNAAILEWERI